ncbi:hypothetical protein DBR43_17540 [Pedobacter sp. KBW06]|uniref:response regulator transcription factor n=1 Tax=Pedobacter sp. KBW06 TaxID=2153359 RepID=UPI000F59A6E3|nr:response regulator transcription factor [Pedobacter sp. KBW06]RQO69857.1 hypothetical protein DBR43_17540 [Pedobacter sp. KBW06]
MTRIIPFSTAKIVDAICIASDNNILCEALFDYLQHRNFENIGVACSEKETLDFLGRCDSSILIISANLLDSTVFQTIDALKKLKTDVKVILLSNKIEVLRYFEESQDGVVKGLLSNHESMSDLYYCIMEVYNSRRYKSSHVKRLLLQSQISSYDLPALGCSFSKIKELTKREMEIFLAISNTLSTRSIAEALFISPATVNNHKASIIGKLSLKGKNQLLSIAVWYRTTLTNIA